jgi:hypothetical protein
MPGRQFWFKIFFYLQVAASGCKWLQISANICKYLQVSLGFELAGKAASGQAGRFHWTWRAVHDWHFSCFSDTSHV